MATVMEQHVSTPMSTCDKSSPDGMSADNGEKVWVGFIDVLPVIGSEEWAVKSVLDEAGGGPLLLKEKERMMRKLEEKTDSGRSTASSSGYCSGEEREVGSVKRVVLNDLLYSIQTGKGDKGKQSGRQNPASAEDKKKKIDAIQRETLQKIRLIDPDFEFEEPLKDTRKRSKRGEHVINNHVIKFHLKVVEKYMINLEDQISPDVRNPLKAKTQNDIMKVMVARFRKDELYINANELVYQKYKSELTDALVEFLNDGSQDSRDRASKAIQSMNQCSAYVDFLAKAEWMQNDPKKEKRQTFDAARNEVAEMFEVTCGIEFFAELRNYINSNRFTAAHLAQWWTEKIRQIKSLPIAQH